jgi:hypothetical protein
MISVRSGSHPGIHILSRNRNKPLPSQCILLCFPLLFLLDCWEVLRLVGYQCGKFLIEFIFLAAFVPQVLHILIFKQAYVFCEIQLSCC